MRKTCFFVFLGLEYANLMVSFFVCFFQAEYNCIVYMYHIIFVHQSVD